MDWDSLFMTMAYLVAMKSKDNSTHLGAIIVSPTQEIRSFGFNGLARGLNDDVPERNIRDEKYFWYEHAERNAIYNAGRMGVPIIGCKMYTNGTPCMDCGRAIIQSGIKEVIVDKNWDDNNINKESKVFANQIVEYVMNVSNIIKDLSIYSKTLRKEDLVDVDLNDVIKESLKLVQYSSNFLEIEIKKELSKIPKIKAAKGELQQVFINLFNNAIFAMDGKGVLKIISKHKNKNIIITISDEGCGIRNEDQKYIFDLY